MEPLQSWSNEACFPITICDAHGVVVAMNQKSIEQFENDGGKSLIGQSLMDCHPTDAKIMLVHMLKSQQPHTYISTEGGRKTVIHETPWFENGVYRGFVEISFELPATIGGE